MALARAEEVKEVEDVVVSTKKNGIFRTFSSRTLLKKIVLSYVVRLIQQ